MKLIFAIVIVSSFLTLGCSKTDTVPSEPFSFILLEQGSISSTYTFADSASKVAVSYIDNTSQSKTFLNLQTVPVDTTAFQMSLRVRVRFVAPDLAQVSTQKGINIFQLEISGKPSGKLSLDVKKNVFQFNDHPIYPTPLNRHPEVKVYFITRQ